MRQTWSLQSPYRGNNRFENADFQNDDLPYREAYHSKTHRYLSFDDLFLHSLEELQISSKESYHGALEASYILLVAIYVK